MARSIVTKRAWPTAAGLLIAAALLAGSGCAAEETATAPVLTPTVSATTTDTSTPETDPWLRTAAGGQTQTRGGLTIRLGEVTVGAVEKALGEIGTPGAELGNEWTDAKAVVAVAFEVYNPTTSSITIPIHTNTRIVVNDQQVGIDFPLSDVEVSILPSALQEMQVVAPVSRYSAEEIETVRFVLEMSAPASPEETFDFTVAIP